MLPQSDSAEARATPEGHQLRLELLSTQRRVQSGPETRATEAGTMTVARAKKKPRAAAQAEAQTVVQTMAEAMAEAEARMGWQVAAVTVAEAKRELEFESVNWIKHWGGHQSRLHIKRYWQIRNSRTSFTPSNPTIVVRLHVIYGATHALHKNIGGCSNLLRPSTAFH